MRIKVISIVCCAIGITAMTAGNPLSAESVMKNENNKSVEPRQETKMERFLSGKLPIGFYIYTGDWRQSKDAEAHDLDNAIEEMAKRGFNYLYVGGTGDTPLWAKLLALCQKHHIAVVPQLDFAYLGSSKANVKKLVDRAVPFIKKYKDHPALMAFSVCEEPGVKKMPPLKQYYEGILREVPDAPLHLVMNHLPQFVNMEPPYPGVMGTDRYAFWWEMSGQRATPWYALNWYHTQLDRYYQLTTQRGADFQAVFTASTLETFASPETLKSWLYPNTMALSPKDRKNFFIDPTGALSAEDRNQLYNTIVEFAAKKNQGWDQGPQGNLRFWKYYRPPVNCVRAMSWLGIMEGARSVAVWAWQPPYEKMKNFAHRTNGKPGPEYINSITGWDGKGTPQLEEYTEFAGQIQRYARLVRAMSKECVPLDKNNLPLGHELAANTEGAKVVFDAKGDDVTWQSFKVPGYSGKVVLVVNTAVGSWCEGRSPHYLSPKDMFRIDDFGKAVDYTPFKEARDLTCCILVEGMECVDLATGKPVTLKDDQTMTMSVVPGGGRFLFLAPKGSDEWIRLKQKFEL